MMIDDEDIRMVEEEELEREAVAEEIGEEELEVEREPARVSTVTDSHHTAFWVWNTLMSSIMNETPAPVADSLFHIVARTQLYTRSSATPQKILHCQINATMARWIFKEPLPTDREDSLNVRQLCGTAMEALERELAPVAYVGNIVMGLMFQRPWYSDWIVPTFLNYGHATTTSLWGELKRLDTLSPNFRAKVFALGRNISKEDCLAGHNEGERCSPSCCRSGFSAHMEANKTVYILAMTDDHVLVLYDIITQTVAYLLNSLVKKSILYWNCSNKADWSEECEVGEARVIFARRSANNLQEMKCPTLFLDHVQQLFASIDEEDNSNGLETGDKPCTTVLEASGFLLRLTNRSGSISISKVSVIPPTFSNIPCSLVSLKELLWKLMTGGQPTGHDPSQEHTGLTQAGGDYLCGCSHTVCIFAAMRVKKLLKKETT